jgi:hypothetical protein
MNISAKVEQFTADEAAAVVNRTAPKQAVQISGNE